MSSASTPPSSLPPPSPLGSPLSEKQEIKLISHSMLFYWWPIWVLGYVLAAMTYFEDNRLAIVPDGSKVTVIAGEETDNSIAYRLAVKKPTTKSLDSARKATESAGEEAVFKPRVTQKAWMGPVFCCVLLMTTFITNVPLRGLWSFLVLLLILILALLITIIPHGWDSLLGAVFNLHVFINMAGYLFIATTVLILWVVSVFVFDQRTYMIAAPGQVRICEHIGASVRNIDASRVDLEKRRDDIFRHWLLGFFSGDLIIHLHDTKEEIRLPNVLWISWHIEKVQRLLREKAMTTM